MTPAEQLKLLYPWVNQTNVAKVEKEYKRLEDGTVIITYKIFEKLPPNKVDIELKIDRGEE